MTTIMFLGSAIAFLLGMIVLATSKGAIHEIESFMLLLISSLLFVGGSINRSINKVRDQMSDLTPPEAANNDAPVEPEIAAKSTTEPSNIDVGEWAPSIARPPENKAPPPVSSWVEQAKAELNRTR